jgi:2-methylcitrate dehydratase PrpD
MTEVPCRLSERSRWPLDRIAAFAVDTPSAAFPDETFHGAQRGVLDHLAVLIAGSAHDTIAPLRNYVHAAHGGGSAYLIGDRSPVRAEGAALFNGSVAHILDFDDGHPLANCHPTAPVLSALFALAQESSVPISQERLLEAYIVGVEVTVAIAASMLLVHYEQGWHPTATVGTFAAVAAGGRLLGLSKETVVGALGIAASLTSGIKGNFGTPMKPVQVGMAGAKAIQALRMAEAGITSNPEVFQSRYSFPMVFNSQPIRDWSHLEELGRVWAIVEPGLGFKQYPCCGSTHAPIDVVRDLRTQESWTVDDIVGVTVSTHPRRLGHTDRPEPLSGLDGKFSVQYVTALAVATGRVAPVDFEGDQFMAPDVRRVLDVTHAVPLPESEWAMPTGREDCWAGKVAIELADGRTLSGFAEVPRGIDSLVPLSDDDLVAKFLWIAEPECGVDGARAALDAIGAWQRGDATVAELFESINDRMSSSSSPAVVS